MGATENGDAHVNGKGYEVDMREAHEQEEEEEDEEEVTVCFYFGPLSLRHVDLDSHPVLNSF